MKKLLYVLIVIHMFTLSKSTCAQTVNWSLVIQDYALGTPANQVNGITRGRGWLYATIFNFTGTSASDDGTGTPAPPTSLSFAGFGFTRNPGQDDLESLFVSDPRIPGFPSVEGSMDGSTPGTSGYLVLGTFDLSGLEPGTYEEDFTAGAYASDIISLVPFDDIQGTLTLNVTAAIVPEPGLAFGLCGLLTLGVLMLRLQVRRLDGVASHGALTLHGVGTCVSKHLRYSG